MSELKRTAQCGSLRAANIGEEVVLSGWVNRRRDHGGLIFVDLRDRSGLVQVVFNQELSAEALKVAESIRGEFVLTIRGQVIGRVPEAVNPRMATGEVEVVCSEIEILNTARTPVFDSADGIHVDENVRLKHRYLDLRRPEMQQNMILRHRVTMAMRQFLDSRDFLEIETPMLTRSTPEGARDYLVPSRVNPGHFFALPQSPQIYKQMLMVSGMERYFQIARCFRDEDLRADRQPEFTQLDMEMSFVDREDVRRLIEELMQHVFLESLGRKLPDSFPIITYQDAMDRYGSDRPDLRFGMELVTIGDLMENTGFQVFSSVLQKGGQIKGINARGCAGYSRRDIDSLMEVTSTYGAKGLAWIAFTGEEIKSPIRKFLSEEEMEAIRQRLDAQDGDLLLFVADTPKVVAAALGALRIELAHRLDLIDPDELNFAWVVDFPLFEYDPAEKRYVAIHHMFTAPHPEDLELLDSDPLQVRAQAYDLILNGIELGGGSIRIHRSDLQQKVFDLVGLTREEAREKFGFMLDAFQFGAPPHGGVAFGLDRMIMLMRNRESIRDVIAFPKTQSASDLMMDAPGTVDDRQLQELFIRLNLPAAQKG